MKDCACEALGFSEYIGRSWAGSMKLCIERYVFGGLNFERRHNHMHSIKSLVAWQFSTADCGKRRYFVGRRGLRSRIRRGWHHLRSRGKSPQCDGGHEDCTKEE